MITDSVLILDVILKERKYGNDYWQDAIAIYDGELSRSLDEIVAFQFRDFNEFMESGNQLYDGVTIVKVLDWHVEENR